MMQSSLDSMFVNLLPPNMIALYGFALAAQDALQSQIVWRMMEGSALKLAKFHQETGKVSVMVYNLYKNARREVGHIQKMIKGDIQQSSWFQSFMIDENSSRKESTSPIYRTLEVFVEITRVDPKHSKQFQGLAKWFKVNDKLLKDVPLTVGRLVNDLIVAYEFMRLIEPLVIENSEFMASLKSPFIPSLDSHNHEQTAIILDDQTENLQGTLDASESWSVVDKLSSVSRGFFIRLQKHKLMDIKLLDVSEFKESHIRIMYRAFSDVKESPFFRHQFELLSQSLPIPELLDAPVRTSTRKKKSGKTKGKKSTGLSPEGSVKLVDNDVANESDNVIDSMGSGEATGSSESMVTLSRDSSSLASQDLFDVEQLGVAETQEKEEELEELRMNHKEPTRATEKRPKKVDKPASLENTAYKIFDFSNGDLCSNLPSLRGSNRAVYVDSIHSKFPIVLSRESATTLCIVFSKIPGQVKWQNVVTAFEGCKGRAEHKFASVWVFYGPTKKKRLDQPHGGGEVKLRRTVHFIKKAFEDLLDMDVLSSKWKMRIPVS